MVLQQASFRCGTAGCMWALAPGLAKRLSLVHSSHKLSRAPKSSSEEAASYFPRCCFRLLAVCAGLQSTRGYDSRSGLRTVETVQ
eukprot:3934687-Rhodomonas_salina.1